MEVLSNIISNFQEPKLPDQIGVGQQIESDIIRT